MKRLVITKNSVVNHELQPVRSNPDVCYSYYGLAVYVKEELLFIQDLSLENFVGSYLCSQLALLHSQCLLFPVSITLFIFMYTLGCYFF